MHLQSCFLLPGTDMAAYARCGWEQRRLLLFRCAFRDGPQARETLFEIAADHLVHTHEEAQCLWNEAVPTRHAPSDRGLASFGFHGELREGSPGKRSEEIKLDPHPIGRVAIYDRHPPCADVAVAGPC